MSVSVSVTSPEDVVNVALTRMGFKGRVTNLFEGSPAANAALNLYGQTRDEMLREGPWGFAERNAALAVLKTAPPGGYVPPNVWNNTYPPPPWIFEYAYPVDALKIRSIKRQPIFATPELDPQPVIFRIENDGAAKVILCNVASAIATYTARVTDPTVWEASFVEALAAALARRLAPVLMTPEAAKMEMADETQADVLAAPQQG